MSLSGMPFGSIKMKKFDANFTAATCRQTSKRMEDKRSKNALCNMGMPFVSSEKYALLVLYFHSPTFKKLESERKSQMYEIEMKTFEHVVNVIKVLIFAGTDSKYG